MSLKERTYTAVRWTAVGSITRALLHLVQLVVLTRLLTPEDFGLMALVAVVLSFTAILSDLGLNSAYLQRQNVSEEERSSLYWSNLLMSIVLAGLLVSISPLISASLGEERLTPLIALSSLTFICNAFGQQLKMNAEKMLLFRTVIIVEVSSLSVGFLVAISAALSGMGVYSLIYGSIVAALSSSILAWIFLSNGWRPLWHFSLKDAKSFLGFGGAMVGNSIVNQVNMTLDLLLGGRMLLASQLGLYSVPRNLILQLQSLINPMVTRIGFPLIASVQDDKFRVRSIYLRTVRTTTAISAPLYLFVAFNASYIVEVFLGASWAEAGQLLRVLALWGLVRSTINPVGSLLFGVGRADLSLKWNIALLFIIPPSLWFGSLNGPLGLSVALLATQVGLFIPAWYFLVKPLCNPGFLEYTRCFFQPAFIALVANCLAYLLASQLAGDIARAIVAGVVAAALYVVLSFRWNREWIDSVLHLARPKAPS